MHRQQHARRTAVGVMPRMRYGARRLDVRSQRLLVVRLRQGRDERHELRHEEQHAPEAPEP